MPELPEVETIVNGLKPQLVGHTIVDVRHSSKNLRYPLPHFTRIHHATITNIHRRAKYLIFSLDNEQSLLWHLGMTGQFHVLASDAQAGKHEHVTMDLSGNIKLCYRDTRRFGYVDICDTAQLAHHPWLTKLGVEPLTDNFHAKQLKIHLQTRNTSIKQNIMDNAIVVGVGNIYASESLFRANIAPTTPAKSLSSQQLCQLVLQIRNVLQEAIAAGGSTISDFVKADGQPGYFAHSFNVYGRDGKPCLVCHSPIQRIVQAGRASFFCPTCQK